MGTAMAWPALEGARASGRMAGTLSGAGPAGGSSAGGRPADGFAIAAASPGCTIKSARAPERQSARAPERQSARAP